MFFLSIDIGIKNCGLTIFNLNDKQIIIQSVLDNWNNLTTSYLNNFIKYFNINNNYIIIIEKQLKGRKNIYLHGFINAYFQNLNYKIINSNSFSFNIKSLKSYKQRKKLSEYYFKKIFKYGSSIGKIDDLADSLCMGLVNINNMLNICKGNKQKIMNYFLINYDLKLIYIYIIY
jgi:hypothetical protein